MSSLRLHSCVAAVGCWLLLAPASVLAATADPYGENKPLDLPTEAKAKAADVAGGGGSLARTLLGMAVVVAVIYGVAWVMKQMKGVKTERATGFGLSSEAVIPLGPNRSVHLIRAGRDLVLVGSAEQGVVPIKTYTEDEARRIGLLPPQELTSGEDAPVAGSGPAWLEALKRRTAR
jgi:flagellar protein FliO/FliZ